MPALHRIHQTPDEEAFKALDVIFIHGLDGDPIKTWSSRAQDSFWPRWLAEEHADVNVWSLGYSPNSSNWSGETIGILDRSVSLLAFLESYGLGKRPICLVTHSLGGLLAKQMIIQASKRGASSSTAAIARMVKGVVFLAAPHNGAALAKVASMMPPYRPTALARDLARDEPLLRHLGQDYRNWVAENQPRHLVFFETQKVRPRGRLSPGVMVVTESSADPGLPGVSLIPIDANHAHICKPRSRNHEVYRLVSQLVSTIKEEVSAPVTTDSAIRPSSDNAPPRRDHDRRSQVLLGRGWLKTLDRLYPNHPSLEYAGSRFPIWTHLAPEGQRADLDAVLGTLSPGEDPRFEDYPRQFDPSGRTEYYARLAGADARSSYNGATYALDRIDISPERLTIHARHGTYFHSVATAESLEAEIEAALIARPDVAVTIDDLPRRQWLHKVGDGERVIFDGRNRSAALSVAAAVIISEPDGGYTALMARRSANVQTHPLMVHVAPSGIFAPINAEMRENQSEYSVRNCILREYAEELFGYRDLEQGEGLMGRAIREVPPVRELLKAEAEARVIIRFCGISVPLFSLRPEVVVLIFVQDPSWFSDEVSRAHDSDHWFEMNWEYDGSPGAQSTFRLDEDFHPIVLDQVRPDLMVPHGAAALSLATAVARQERNREQPPGGSRNAARRHAV